MPAKLPDGEGKRFAVTIRTTRELKDRVEATAAASNRSVAQEIERRIQYSFNMEDHEVALENTEISKSIDKETNDMITCMRASIGAAIFFFYVKWKYEIYTRASVRAAVIAVLDTTFKKYPVDIDPDALDRARATQADKFGRLAGRMISGAQSDPAMRAWISEMADAAEAREGLSASENEIDPKMRPSATINALIGKDVA
ncbi:hypothetical protein [Methylobacterium sp. WL8]|uniref:hypothetical protein n=1 Tax=Methylobacterium sp. WL8 TaxID=2603899 RepID=UPI0011C9660F|nr:hypothetical protein [Methylobacterium sp. WL8]TXN76565.1 hypothetical protein FV234_24560 [Methylobacterium sp. WL8]